MGLCNYYMKSRALSCFSFGGMDLCIPRATIFLFFIIILLMVIPSVSSLSFKFSTFNQSSDGMVVTQGDAFINQGIQLTRNQLGTNITNSVGRVVYSQPIPLWDSGSGELADFTAQFSFVMNALGASSFGDGLAFFLSPYPSAVPNDSAGGSLGLFSSATALNASDNRMVAVEFDTFQNSWDPSPNHVGIDVNSIASVAIQNWTTSIKDGRVANAWVKYNATSHNLSVFLTYKKDPIFSGNSTLSHKVDLREVLPEMVAVGFSAATSQVVELHTILSWNFMSNLEYKSTQKSSKAGLIAGVVIGAGVLIALLVLMTWIILRRMRKDRGHGRGEEHDYDGSIDDEFEKGRGPKRFPYNELAAATNNFTEDLKLGEGGFGAVYKGLLSDPNLEVAIKRVSKGSKQGKKEYISEVKIISRVRHRNLVQLIGWCHERGEFMLVYELMPNGSLDSHLYTEKRMLAWPQRYKIAVGVATALLYLHEESEQCVVHRDVKPSNVMLDAMFNAKLGDFGLARFVEHGRGSQTTILAGTMGYLAPECVTSGKASKESDVYSFGVVALEMACGRRPVEIKELPERVRLVEWVWGLHGRRMVLDAADPRLNMFDELQMERLMVVGLWCAHPDYNMRPSMRQAIAALNFEGPLPDLPPQMPVPMYCAPPMDMFGLTHTSSQASSTGTTGYTSSSRASSNSTRSSHTSPSVHLLKQHKIGM